MAQSKALRDELEVLRNRVNSLWRTPIRILKKRILFKFSSQYLFESSRRPGF
jgi:hypothetical protein